MTHEEIKNLLNDYFDERLSTEVNTEIEIHISECSECSQYLFSLQDLLKKTGMLPRSVKPETNFWDDIFVAMSDIKSQTIKEKEELQSIETEQTKSEKEESRRINEKKLKAKKLLQHELWKAALYEKIHQPIYKYLLIAIPSLVILFLVYNFFIKSAESWEVKKLTSETSNYSENYGDLPLNDVLQSNSVSRLQVYLPEIGNILLEPDTKIQSIESNKIQLFQGTITVVKDGATKFFNVAIPGAEVNDFFLGGSYKLSVIDRNSVLQVSEGWVSIKKDGKESIVLAKHLCRVDADSGLGIPYSINSSAEFRNAIDKYVFSSTGNEEFLLGAVSRANKSDAVSIWNLVRRVYYQQREMVISALFNVVPPPFGVNFEGIKALDKNMMQRYLEEIEINL